MRRYILQRHHNNPQSAKTSVGTKAQLRRGIPQGQVGCRQLGRGSSPSKSKVVNPVHDAAEAKIEEMSGPRNQAVIIVYEESMAPIDAAGRELNFGFSSDFIRVYKSVAAVCSVPSNNPVEEDIA
ncbi:hypothetical protein ACLKA7_001549 [Drosophila subpalustris]